MKYLRGSKISQIDIADDFYDAYKICFSTGSNRIYAIPGFVNGLFACELYLKIMIGNKIQNLHGKDRHNLYSLYCLLEDSEKDILKSVKSDKDFPFEELLKNVGDGYINWRYLYEEGNEGFGQGKPFLYTEIILENYLPTLKMMAHTKNN